ncbi:MAG: hypothetical protein AAF628_24800 [Planctomycetota bacterium]
MAAVTLQTAVIESVALDPLRPRAVASRFRALMDDGVPIRCAGAGREDPRALAARYVPRSRLSLFDHDYYLGDYRYDDLLNFMVAWVAPTRRGRPTALFPRAFYKDSSLVWRVATHLVDTADEAWVGKGDVTVERRRDGEYEHSAEETTNLPYELQDALNQASRITTTKRRDDRGLALVVRSAPASRLLAFPDFTGPRERAQASYRIHGGRPVARFRRRGDPSSLVFARGFAPDFAAGCIDRRDSGSRLFGGAIGLYRILSENRRVQYQFVAGPHHVWMNPPQALTTDLSSYGVRTVDAWIDDLACLPGYEYHFVEDSGAGSMLHSQIPVGFAGPASDVDPDRADASEWIEALPVIRQFRREVLGERRRGRRRQ